MNNEPARTSAVAGLITSTITLLIAFGVHVPVISDPVKNGIAMAIVAGINWLQGELTRAHVTPLAKAPINLGAGR